MKLKLAYACLAATGALLVGTAITPASAGTPMSDAFIANVRPNVIFLDESSRLALDKSTNRGIRSFAHTEARQQTIAANSLTAWTQTYTRRGEAVALGTPMVGTSVIAAPVVAPVVAAGDVAYTAGGVLTGRSVAIDAPMAVAAVPVYGTTYGPTLGSQLLPAQRDNLNRLQLTSGRTFDRLYISTQLDGLGQLATLYRDYSLNGDDPSLRAIATTELPKINARIRELRRM